MVLGLQTTLPALVDAQYSLAKSSKSLIYTSSELTTIKSSSNAPFQLRFCPSLAKKPTAQDKPKGPKPDPFEKPTGDLFIANIPPAHLLVLNKFPIIDRHFILATRAFKAQTDPLEADDLTATYACLQEWEAQNSSNGRLFAFFNSGPHSGASQPHRHVQFLPVEDIADDDANFQLLIDSESNLAVLPFKSIRADIPPESAENGLHPLYLRLLAQCRDSWTGETEAFSYNMGLTLHHIVLVPRTAEGMTVRKEDGSEVCFVGFNGTLLAGSLMVKRQEEWDYLRQRPEALDEVLNSIGIPNNK
ncbi:HIT-like protein [Microthyrium microscopicum]|uniref:HIT-like protein n=1 Tax=Microthyrium microscopicum TaxID=703497 RepID=A0A6A6U3Z9_9PEZI|nr:HIT-like protein [Microthyrium microscopicum]